MRKEWLKELWSSYSEWHAWWIGIYAGLVEWHGIDSKTMQNEDVQRDFHYAAAGYVVGTVLRWIFILSVGYAFFTRF